MFTAIGTTHGSGDGATTFNVPDYRGRVFLGLDNQGGSDAGRLSAANTLGGSGGAETHTLATTNLPSHDHGAGTYAVGGHTHDLGNHTHSGTTGNQSANHAHDMNDVYNQGGLYTSGPNGGGSGNTINNVNTRATANNNADHTHSFTTGGPSTNTSGSTTPTFSGTSGATGGGTAVNHLPPYLLCHVIIKC